jgi:CBS domain containing-hemolysin-like protein
VVGEQEQLILEALAEVRDMDVREVMTPRVDVVALSIPVQADDVARAVRESGHSCFPVVHDDLDDVVGVLFVNDLFRSGRRGAESAQDPSPLDISRRLRLPYLIPESLHILDALVDMRRQHRGFAFVVDEYGGVSGVLTVKDLLEPLVGDLHDEFDSANDEPTVVRVDGSRWLVDGRANVDDVRDKLGVEIPEGEYITLGGYLFDGFGHIPEEGESLDVGDWELKVAEMDKRRIAKVVVRHRTGAPGASPPGRAEPMPPSGSDDGRAAGGDETGPVGPTSPSGAYSTRG